MFHKSSLLRVAFICAALFIVSGCAARTSGYTPNGWSPLNGQIQMVLKTAGENRAELEKFLNACKGNPEKLQAAMFLTANLPPCDRATLSAELLLDDLNFAFLARETMPWGKDVSWSDFLHYVLPHRVSQEKAVNWRKPFFKEIMPLVADCKTMEEATLKINRWCFERTGFQSTQRWDQNPLMTINRGLGRCEEAVIFLVSALRTAGIPARQAMVPAWQHSNDNHTWTEVLTKTGWHYLESANPDFGLDHAWFSGSVRKAPLVLSYAYGHLKSQRYPIQKENFGCTIFNTTSKYAPASPLKINLSDTNGKPLQSLVVISVFNYGTFSPVSILRTDEKGKAEMIIGPGSVLVSAATGNASVFKVSTWIPGETKKRPALNLRLVKNNNPAGSSLMRFSYKDKSALKTPAHNSEGSKKEELTAIKNIRKHKFQAISAAAVRFNKHYGKNLAKAGLNLPEVLKAADNCPEKDLAVFYRMISEMTPADLSFFSSTDLIDNLQLSIKARKLASQNGIKYDDDIFFNFVLNPRIMYEQPGPWRKVLSEKILPQQGTPLGVNRLCAALKKVARGTLGSSLTPAGVLKSGRASTISEKCVFATAALRTFGIPARFLPEQGWVEFYDGKQWEPLFPDNPKQLGNKHSSISSKSYYAKWGELTFNVASLKNKGRYPQYFKDFSLSKLCDNKYFELVEKSIAGGYNTEKKSWTLKVPDGTYWLIYGRRNSKGEPLVFIHKVKP